MEDHVTISTFELFSLYPDADAARLYLERLRWNGKPTCPHCKHDKITTRGGKRTGYFRCHRCIREFTVRTGSIFERSSVPLNKWLYSMYLVVTSRKGISSLQLSKEIGVTQKTAWFMLGRIREACAPSGKKLSGIVEADEVYIGGLERNKHESKKLGERAHDAKTPVLGMRERGGRSIALVVDEVTKTDLQQPIPKHTETGSTVYTDEHGAYENLPNRKHGAVNHSAGQYVGADNKHINSTESMWALLRRSIHGTWHQVSEKHLNRYVNEATMRLNEENVENHTLERLEALSRRAFTHRLTYKELTA